MNDVAFKILKQQIYLFSFIDIFLKQHYRFNIIISI
jgi:hypothetical protein